jgi:ABC-type multidrug transport system fused ATPase/permease subunit
MVLIQNLLVHLRYSTIIIKNSGLKANKIIFVLFTYYLLVLINATLDSLTLILIASFITASSGLLDNHAFYFNFILNFINTNDKNLLLRAILLLLFVTLLTRFSIVYLESSFAAILRRYLQEAMFKRIIFGNWIFLNCLKVGECAGSIAQEALHAVKYIMALVGIIYFLINILVLSTAAILISEEIFIFFCLITLPIFIFFKFLINRQTKLSKKFADVRNYFSGDITNRLTGLFQILIEPTCDHHIKEGLRRQKEMTHLELTQSKIQAFMSLFGTLLPFIVFSALYFSVTFFSNSPLLNLTLLATIGLIGMRLASQFQGFVSSASNLSRLSGSLYPVVRLLQIPRRPIKEKIREKVVEIRIDKVAFSYQNATILSDICLKIKSGFPLCLIGASGSGKTTLANLITGLLEPTKGNIFYVGESTNFSYNSKQFNTQIGYVPQDIYLFDGSLRENLRCGREITDEAIWKALETVDALDFVLALGGLDINVTEAGKSLSGGQRRRIGIARVILLESEVLVFDESTAGLDKLNSKILLELVSKLAKSRIIVLISHDKIDIPNLQYFSL